MSKRKKIQSILFIAIFLAPSICFSAPNITNVSGIIQNQQTITITGIEFRNKDIAMPLITSYNSNNAADNWSTGSIGPRWYQQYAG